MKKLIPALGLMLLCLGVSQTAYAGSINANEQAVINAAGGTFTYNGEQYKVDPTYTSKLQDYLMKDGVDLTAEQRDQALSSVNSYIERGVKEGYLIPVNGQSTTPNTGSSSSNTTPNTTPSTTPATNTDTKTDTNQPIDNTKDSNSANQVENKDNQINLNVDKTDSDKKVTKKKTAKKVTKKKTTKKVDKELKDILSGKSSKAKAASTKKKKATTSSTKKKVSKAKKKQTKKVKKK